MEKVLVIIINYKTSELMPELLRSVQETNVDVTIAILDNASTPATLEPLKALADPRVQVLASAANLGFTGGINHVLKSSLATSGGYRYFFLLNPDAFSKPNLIGDLTGILREHTNAASVSPRILFMDGKPWYQGGKIHYEQGKVLMEKEEHAGSRQRYMETDVFNGCAALFDFKKVTEAGLFNEDLFMYYDEADMSIRLKKLGYSILFAPSLEIYHDVSYTTKHISHLKTYYMTRNKFLVFGKEMSLRAKAYYLVHELAYHLKHKRIKNAWYHVKGYLHFTKGKFGALQNI
jgi:GT2 family glycosyltransferase